MPPKCSICTHEQVADIDKAIAKHNSFRHIASQFPEIGYRSVCRHAENCLQLDLQAVREVERVARVIDVHAEFAEQLDFAKRLRIAAEQYLSDPLDPLLIHLIPDAREIDVSYLDHEDMEQTERGPRPKKKTAKLDILLVNVEALRNIEVGKVQIKHLDLRKFALDAIATTDMVIDKFARMGGSYQKNKSNDADVEHLIDQLVQRLIQKGWEAAAARQFAKSKYQDLPQLIPAKVG
jgi:hypothetical protein